MKKHKIRIKATCGHGKTGTVVINLPLTAAVMAVKDEVDLEQGARQEYVVWLQTKQDNGLAHYHSIVMPPSTCKKKARFVATVFNSYLKTSAGQKAAIKLVRHDY